MKFIRRRMAFVLVAGLLAVGLTGIFESSPGPALGQTGPRRPTEPASVPASPVATPPAAVPVIVATIVVEQPSRPNAPLAPFTPVPSGPAGGFTVPGIATLSSAGASTAQDIAPPSLVGASSAQGVATSSLASATPLTGGTVPGLVLAPVGVDARSATGPTPLLGERPPLSRLLPPVSLPIQGPLVSGVIPAAGPNQTTGVASITTGAGAPVRVTVLVPPRLDGPTRVQIGVPDVNEIRALYLPGVAISRAFTLDVTGVDGARLTTHPRPLTIAVAYTDADVAISGGDVQRLRIIRWDDQRSVAVVLPTRLDQTALSITAETRQTSLFLIAAIHSATTNEIAAVPSAPWGTEPVTPSQIPRRVPNVGSEPAAPPVVTSPWYVLIPLLAISLVAIAILRLRRKSTDSVLTGEHRPRIWRARGDWRWLVFGFAVAAALGMLDPTVRLIASTVARAPKLLLLLAGVGWPSNLLVIAQSTDEPRATGGFMGSFGLVTMRNGQIVDFVYRNSSEFEQPNVAHVPPPMPLQRYAGLGGWLMRDANWSPDFPTSIAQLDHFWAREQPTRFDVAITVNEMVLEMLLRATGPIVVPETGETVDAENVRRWILWQLYPLGRDGMPTYQIGAKSEVLSSLGRALTDRLSHPSPGEAVRYARVFARLAGERHVMVWFRDPGLQSLAADWGIDGRVLTTDGDYLAVVDSSVAYTKVAQYVSSTVDYVAEAGFDQRLVGSRVTVTYENRYNRGAARRLYPPLYLALMYNPRLERFEHIEGMWATWLRVLVPNGAVLRGSSGLDEAPAVTYEAGKTVFGAYVAIGEGERRRVSFEYDVPDTRPSGQYSLLVQNQPGLTRTLNIALRVPNADTAIAEPRITASNDIIRWQTVGALDTRVRVTFAP